LSLDQFPTNAAINLSRFAEHSSSVPLPHQPEIFTPPQKQEGTYSRLRLGGAWVSQNKHGILQVKPERIFRKPYSRLSAAIPCVLI
jgi:hypothetical protein